MTKCFGSILSRQNSCFDKLPIVNGDSACNVETSLDSKFLRYKQITIFFPKE